MVLVQSGALLNRDSSVVDLPVHHHHWIETAHDSEITRANGGCG